MAAGSVFAPGTPPLDLTVFGHAGVLGGCVFAGEVSVFGLRGGELAGGGVGSTGVGMGRRRRHASACSWRSSRAYSGVSASAGSAPSISSRSS